MNRQCGQKSRTGLIKVGPHSVQFNLNFSSLYLAGIVFVVATIVDSVLSLHVLLFFSLFFRFRWSSVRNGYSGAAY